MTNTLLRPLEGFYLRAVIIASGWLNEPEHVKNLIHPTDLLIAADGGAEHFRVLDLLPHILVGDLDSITPDTLLMLQSAGVEIQRYDPRKDYTDLELALRLAQERGAGQALVFGAVGSRWDQTIASLLLPAAADLRELDVRLLDGHQELRLLNGGERLEMQGQPGDTVSLIPLSATALGITTHGLEYPLTDEVLHLGATRGVSNVLLETQATISLHQGLLLCVIQRQGSVSSSDTAAGAQISP